MAAETGRAGPDRLGMPARRAAPAPGHRSGRAGTAADLMPIPDYELIRKDKKQEAIARKAM